MSHLEHCTLTDESPQGKQKVYLCFHPDNLAFTSKPSAPIFLRQIPAVPFIMTVIQKAHITGMICF